MPNKRSSDRIRAVSGAHAQVEVNSVYVRATTLYVKLYLCKFWKTVKKKAGVKVKIRHF